MQLLTPGVLHLDAAAAAAEIEAAIRAQVPGTLKRRGVVLGLSGGVDSSVVAALCARALGPARVVGLLMPERDSAAESAMLAQSVAARLGIRTIIENIAPILAAAGCYARQTSAIRMVFPEYGDGYRCKLTIPSPVERDRLNVSELTIESPDGDRQSKRMSPEAYLTLVASLNFKQRTRKMVEYHHADRLHYAVAGTPNRLEYDQGFFVKQGDGAADLKPIAHLYKTQVYQLSDHLGLPEGVRRRQPTTDTFSLPQSQEEFYFGLPYQQMDLCLYGRNHGIAPAELTSATGLTVEQIMRVYRDIDQKRRSTRTFHLQPLLVQPVVEVGH